jgi:hypothetical protein
VDQRTEPFSQVIEGCRGQNSDFVRGLPVYHGLETVCVDGNRENLRVYSVMLTDDIRYIAAWRKDEIGMLNCSRD